MWQQVRAEVTDDDSLIHEDVDLAIQIYKAGGRILFDPKLTVAVKMRQLYRSPRSTYRYFKRRRSTIEHSK
jgi:GT2 family glycosyltransferase